MAEPIAIRVNNEDDRRPLRAKEAPPKTPANPYWATGKRVRRVESGVLVWWSIGRFVSPQPVFPPCIVCVFCSLREVRYDILPLSEGLFIIPAELKVDLICSNFLFPPPPPRFCTVVELVFLMSYFLSSHHPFLPTSVITVRLNHFLILLSLFFFAFSFQTDVIWWSSVVVIILIGMAASYWWGWHQVRRTRGKKKIKKRRKDHTQDIYSSLNLFSLPLPSFVFFFCTSLSYCCCLWSVFFCAIFLLYCSKFAFFANFLRQNHDPTDPPSIASFVAINCR